MLLETLERRKPSRSWLGSLRAIAALIRVIRFVIGVAQNRARYIPSLVLVGTIATVVFVRAALTWNADGDPALHLRIIKDIASTHRLPTVLPNLPARISDAGEIEMMFPYAYTPLYHLIGALTYLLAGVSGVLLINAAAAGTVAYVILSFTRRHASWPVGALASIGAFVSPHVQNVFANVYMEPLQMGFLFAGVWLVSLALATRRLSFALAAGTCLGLAIGVRQSSLIYVGVVLIAVAISLASRGAWRSARIKKEVGWLSALLGAAFLVAAPSVGYLIWLNGGIGYADVTIPFTGSGPRIDPAANAYIAGITKPFDTFREWTSRYQYIVFFSTRWLPLWTSLILILFASSGIASLYRRGGASRFFARWICIQLAADFAVFVTLHGNERYLIVSHILFYTLVPLGGVSVIKSVWSSGRAESRIVAFSLLITVIALLMPVQYWTDHLLRSQDRMLRTARAEAYRDMGDWVSANTDPQSLFLVPRAYSASLSWERMATWVTFYGNSWVVDVIAESDPQQAHSVLAKHGVDYVVIAAPPGTYVDRMPADGMRSYLQLGKPDTKYFSLVFVTEREQPLLLGSNEIVHVLRLYRVNDVEVDPS